MSFELETPARWRAHPGQDTKTLLGAFVNLTLPAMTRDCNAKSHAMQASRLWRLCREAAQTGARRGMADDVLFQGVTFYAVAAGQRRDLDVMEAAEIAAMATRATIRGALV